MAENETAFTRFLSRRRFMTTSALVAGGTLGAGALLQACGDASSTTETTQLTILAPGDAPIGWNSVLAAVNKKLQAEKNITLKIQWISWATYVNTILLKMTAGDNFDAVLTALWAHLDQFIADKSLVALDDYVAKLPNLQKAVPKILWDANRFTGKIYAVPLGSSLASLWGFVVRKDLRLKYGLPELKTFADVEKFLYTIKAHEHNIVPYGFHKDHDPQNFNNYYWDNQPGSYDPVATAYTYINISDPKHPKAVPFWEYAGYPDAIKRAHRYLQDGIITQDALNISSADMQSLFKQGKFALATEASDGLTTSAFGDVVKNVPGAQLEVVYPFSQPNPRPLNSFEMWNFLAVNKRSQHPDKVMELMDWLSIKENHDLLEYGVVGKNWQPVGDTEYKALDQYIFPGFVMSWRPSLERTPSDMLADEKKWYDFASNISSFTPDPLSGFIFDTKAVKSQISQLDAAATQYKVPLEHGIADPNQGLTQFQNAFKQAGIDAVLAEVQRQVDTFVAKQSK